MRKEDEFSIAPSANYHGNVKSTVLITQCPPNKILSLLYAHICYIPIYTFFSFVVVVFTNLRVYISYA